MKAECKQFYDKIKTGGLTLRWRFMLYVVSAILTSAMLLLLLLNMFGVSNPADIRIETYLDNQLDNHVAQMEHDIDKLAAYSLSFSKQMQTVIEDYLTTHGLTFHDLTNNIEALTALQKKVTQQYTPTFVLLHAAVLFTY